MLTAFVILSATTSARGDVGDAGIRLADALIGIPCAFELAKADLRVAVALPAGVAPCTARITVGVDGPSDGDADEVALSRDGRFVAYRSLASNLVVGDTNGRRDIFTFDRMTIDTARSSVSSAGAQSTADSLNPAISGDGRYVVFRGDGPLVQGVSTSIRVYLRDRDVSDDGFFDSPGDVATILASKQTNGGVYTGGGAAITPDGRFVSFNSSQNLGSDTNGRNDVYVHDRDTDEDGIFDEPGAISLTRVSVAFDGAQGTGGEAATGSMSDDGRHVLFRSDFTNLLGAGVDTNGTTDVFVRDRDTDGDLVFDEPGAATTVRVSVSSAGAQGNGESRYGRINATGRFVAFQSAATNFDPLCTNAVLQIYLHDRDTDEDGIFDEPGAISTECVSLNAMGEAGNGASELPAISASGRYVVYRSVASNLVEGDTNGFLDYFLHDATTGETRRVSVRSDGTQSTAGGTEPFTFPAVVDVGPLVAFTTTARGIVSDDTDSRADIFVVDPDAVVFP
ncbi:MAG: hypothetical protein KC466_07560 [Myxococcales bacterium]|nr:hypothetical protein [Myxococcales bacterium]